MRYLCLSIRGRGRGQPQFVRISGQEFEILVVWLFRVQVSFGVSTLEVETITLFRNVGKLVPSDASVYPIGTGTSLIFTL